MVYDKEVNMNKKSIITMMLALVAMTGQAQITLKGSIVNERGEKIEYVSVGLEAMCHSRRLLSPTKHTPMGSN